MRCSCRQSHYCKSARVKKSAISRCRRNHIGPEELRLPDGRATLNNSLFVIHSHAKYAAVNQHKKLVSQLDDIGVPSENVHVKFGYNFKRKKHNGKRFSHREITHYSALFRWFPKVRDLLNAKTRKIVCVVYLEYNANIKVSASELMRVAFQGGCRSDISWIGFQKVHRPSKYMHGHGKPVIQGSKIIAFKRGGLVRAYQVSAKSRLSHWDLMLCRKLPQAVIYRPAQSICGVRAHASVPGQCKRTATSAVESHRRKTRRVRRRNA